MAAISNLIYKKAFHFVCLEKAITELFEKEKNKIDYTYSTSRGHEIIQIALGLQLSADDYISTYYRDQALLLSLGISPYELFLQLFAKKDDPFSGGRNHYGHAALKRDGIAKILMQSSSTGMQAIPATGVGLGLKYLRQQGQNNDKGIAVCSLGDGCITAGEVSEALHMAALKQLPILFLVQDNDWSLSAYKNEIRSNDAFYFAGGFAGLERLTLDGTDFLNCYNELKDVLSIIRSQSKPFLVHAKVPLLTHHTSKVRAEHYREEFTKFTLPDPYAKLRTLLQELGINENELNELEALAVQQVKNDFVRAYHAAEPDEKDLKNGLFAIQHNAAVGFTDTNPNTEPTFMIDGAINAMHEILEHHPEALFYGQDVASKMGGAFRESKGLAERFGKHRVFNMPIQEAFIIGSTVGLSAVGCKPIVYIPFADFVWPGLNQLFAEVSRSCYFSNNQWPVNCVIRIGVGAYGRGGPYHSTSIESVLTNIIGLKIVYPSNTADMKGLLIAAFHDPNPVVILEHKGLYWSKLKDSNTAKTGIPAKGYYVPIGKANVVLHSQYKQQRSSIAIITYGAGVHWALAASVGFEGMIEIVDLRSLVPLDWETVFISVRKSGKCLIITEEPVCNTFAASLAGTIQKHCFTSLEAPIEIIGALDVPGVPINGNLESAVLPNAEKIIKAIQDLLAY